VGWGTVAEGWEIQMDIHQDTEGWGAQGNKRIKSQGERASKQAQRKLRVQQA